MTTDLLYKLVIKNKLDEFYEHLENGYNIDDVDIHGNTLFALLARDNKFDIIKQIEKYNPNYDTQKDTGNTPLIVVSGRGFVDIVEFLINKNVRINITNKYNDTALHIATKEGNLNVVRMLLDAGADPTIQNTSGNDIVVDSYGDVNVWLKMYDTQKYLLDKYPTLYKSFEKMKTLRDDIKEEFKYIVNANDLNLF